MPAPAQSWSIFRLWLALLLALSGHAGAASSQHADPFAALQAATVFCHSGQDHARDQPVLPHHLQDPDSLQADVACAADFAILHDAAARNPTPLTRVPRFAPAEPRAPPSHAPLAFQARAPPVLI